MSNVLGCQSFVLHVKWLRIHKGPYLRPYQLNSLISPSGMLQPDNVRLGLSTKLKEKMSGHSYIKWHVDVCSFLLQAP